MSVIRDENAHIAPVPEGHKLVEVLGYPIDQFQIACASCGVVEVVPDVEQANAHATQHRINHVNRLIEEMLDGV